MSVKIKLITKDSGQVNNDVRGSGKSEQPVIILICSFPFTSTKYTNTTIMPLHWPT